MAEDAQEERGAQRVERVGAREEAREIEPVAGRCAEPRRAEHRQPHADPAGALGQGAGEPPVGKDREDRRKRQHRAHDRDVAVRARAGEEKGVPARAAGREPDPAPHVQRDQQAAAREVDTRGPEHEADSLRPDREDQRGNVRRLALDEGDLARLQQRGAEGEREPGQR